MGGVNAPGEPGKPALTHAESPTQRPGPSVGTPSVNSDMSGRGLVEDRPSHWPNKERAGLIRCGETIDWPPSLPPCSLALSMQRRCRSQNWTEPLPACVPTLPSLASPPGQHSYESTSHCAKPYQPSSYVHPSLIHTHKRTYTHTRTDTLRRSCQPHMEHISV